MPHEFVPHDKITMILDSAGKVDSRPIVPGEIGEVIQVAGDLIRVRWPSSFATWEWSGDLKIHSEPAWHLAKL